MQYIADTEVVLERLVDQSAKANAVGGVGTYAGAAAGHNHDPGTLCTETAMPVLTGLEGAIDVMEYETLEEVNAELMATVIHLAAEAATVGALTVRLTTMLREAGIDAPDPHTLDLTEEYQAVARFSAIRLVSMAAGGLFGEEDPEG